MEYLMNNLLLCYLIMGLIVSLVLNFTLIKIGREQTQIINELIDIVNYYGEKDAT